MGAGGSKTQVHIHTEKPFYYVGDIVSGFVAFHTEESSMNFNSINLKVTGVEKCEWQEHHGSGENAHTETYRGKKEVFKNKLPLMHAGTLHPGDYQWPFSFQLPPNIPGSFSYSSGHTRASIQYKIKADCDQSGLLKPDYKKTISIEVLEHAKAAGPPEPLALAAEEPISFFCCFNKGVIGLKLEGSSDRFLPGQTMDLRAHVDNKSSTDVPCVEFRLHQRLHLTAKTMFGERTKQFNTTRIYQKQVTNGFLNGAAGSVFHYGALLLLDKALEATCHSQIIHSTYELEVRAKTGCCLSEVVLRKPILLNDPEPVAAPPAIQPPEGWAPQVYPTFQFALPTPEGYQSYNIPQQQQPTVQFSAPAAPYQMQQQPFVQHPTSASQSASITYNITTVNNYAHTDSATTKYPSACSTPGAAVAVYQDGYPPGMGVGPHPAKLDSPGWETAGVATAPVMPGVVGYTQPGY